MVRTRTYLAGLMPLDEILLIRVIDEELHLILRITQEGVIGEPDQFLFKLEEELKNSTHQVFGNGESMPEVFIPSRAMFPQKSEQLKALGIPACADVLVLFHQELRAGLIAVSYRAEAYQDQHLRLFERLKSPFMIALNNALQYIKVKQMHDALVDKNQIFREVTVRLTGEMEIGAAFQKTIQYLKKFMSLEQILLLKVPGVQGGDEQEIRVILQVSERGVIGEPRELLVRPPDAERIAEHEKFLNHLPDTFIMPADMLELTLNVEERAENLSLLGLDPEASIIVLGVKPINSVILFVSRQAYTQREVDLVQLLKEPLLIALSNALRYFEIEQIKDRLTEDNRMLQSAIQRAVGDQVIGVRQGLRGVMGLVDQVARTLSPVLLLGETGSGKEIIATAIHRASNRRAGPLINVNCGAIPESLIDSELFGHERGAFTGAVQSKRGHFERADRGTLFLDEIGELPPSAQVKLLRVLQEKEFERVGGSRTLKADVRLIAATNRDLPRMVQSGQFREDLWFRINVFPITIPPLRERREDIPALAYYFIETKSRELNLLTRPPLPTEELERLVAYGWPGNVRELQNAIERALILSRGEALRFPYLHPPAAEVVPAPDRGGARDALASFEEMAKRYFRCVLDVTGGKIAGAGGAAEITGMNASTLRSKLKKLGITPPRVRGIH